MANEKISELPSGSPAQPGDEIPIARGGQNFALLASDIAALGSGIDVAIDGNTAGVPATISSGTMVLLGGNNITLGQNGNSITIIGAAGGGGGNFSAGISNIGNTAGNTGITGTQLVLAGGNNITLSQFTSPSGATVTVSAGNQSVQTQNAINASIGGNTSGVLALVSSGTLFLAGGNNVTLSQNGNSVTISANTAAAATLSISAGSTSGAFQGVTFSNSNNVSFGLNNGTITASASQVAQTVQTQASGNIGATGFATTTIAGTVVAGTNNTAGFTLAVPPYITAQTTQTQNLIDVSLSGNTAGALALVSSGTMILAGGNNITLSQNAQSITISGAAQSNQSMGIYASSNTIGQSSFSTVDARSFTHVGAGNVSVGMSNGSLIISGATAIPPSTAGINAAGNTTGQSFFSTYQQSSAIFSGAGIISVGWSSNSFIISGPASTGISQSMFAASNTTLGTSGTQSIGSLVLAGAGNVSVGVSNGSYVISGSGGGGGGVNFGVSTAGNTAGATGTVSTGNVVLVGSGPISLSQATGAAGSAATITINAPPISSLSGTGNASISVNGSTISLGANAAALSIGGNSTSAGAGFSNISTGTAVLMGGNNVTLSQNGASITVSAGNQSVQTQASGNIAATGFATTTTNGSVIVGTLNTTGMTLAVPPYITAGGGGNFSAGVSGGNTSNTSGTVSNAFVLAGGNNVTLSASTGAGGMSVTVSAAAQTNQNNSLFALGNTTQNSSTVLGAAALSFNGLGGNTVGFSNGSIQISGVTTAGLISAFKVSGGGSSVNATAITFSNSNNFTFGLSTGASVGTITASFSQSNPNNSLFALGNTTQNSSTVLNNSNLSFNGLGAQTVGFSNGSIQLSVPATSSISGTGLVSVSVNASTISIGAAIPQLSFFQPLGPLQNTTVTQNGAGSVQVYPAIAAFPFSASRADIMISASAAVLAVSTQAQTISMFVGLYSLNGSTLSLASSGSQSYAMTNSSNNSNASITGMRRLSAPINVNYTGGFDLFVGVMTNTTFANTNGMSFSNVVVPLGPGPQLQGLIGQAPANSMQFVPGQGLFSATSAGMPSSMALSAISGLGSGGNAVDNYAPVQFANVTA